MFASQLCLIPAYAYSDSRMSSWWKENKLELTIRNYVDWPDQLRPGHDYDPSTFLQHLEEQGEDSYLHYGVKIYVRELYKDYNGVGHYALFKQTEKKVIDKHRRYNSRQKETPKRDEFEIALDAAKKAAEDRDKKLKQDKLTSEAVDQC